uniref:Uncharacterized protein n=1 Tax=Parascaris univalens TaxID=6257 RepID=A0A915ARF7_PARUN
MTADRKVKRKRHIERRAVRVEVNQSRKRRNNDRCIEGDAKYASWVGSRQYTFGITMADRALFIFDIQMNNTRKLLRRVALVLNDQSHYHWQYK